MKGKTKPPCRDPVEEGATVAMSWLTSLKDPNVTTRCYVGPPSQATLHLASIDITRGRVHQWEWSYNA